MAISFSGSYSQNFNSLANSGTGNTWSNDVTLPGWFLFRQPAPGTAVTAYGATDGSATAGSFYSFGSTGSTERAFGGVGSGGTYFGSPASGAIAGWFALAATNTTGGTLSNVTVAFDGEQWRNNDVSPQTMVLEYGFGSSFTSVSTWTAPGGTFNWTSPVVGGMAAPVNGNTTGLVSERGGLLSGLNWANGDTLWLRWVERNDVGSDHALAIDNFSLSIPVSQPDLTISQTDAPDPVVVGSPLTYTLTVNNSGGANATGVDVQYTLPSGVSFVSATGTGFTVSPSGGVVNFTGGAINAGGSATLTVVVTPTAAGTLTSGTAVVDPANTIVEINETNNTASTVTTLVQSNVLPSVSITASDATAAEVGAANGGTFTISRTGDVTAPLTVSYTVSGTAGTGITSDYTPALTGTAVIAAGQASVNIAITPFDDALVEGSETVILTVTDTADYDLGASSTATVTIADNPAPFLRKIGGFTSTNGAEISAFDPASDRLFVVAGNTIEILNLSNPASPTLIGTLTPGFPAPTGTALIPNSVAVRNGLVAVAYAVRETATGVQQAGRVAFFNAADGSFVNGVTAGALPDMLTFTPDGTKVVVANEGEPNSYGQTTSVDPEGSVSIIDVSAGAASATVQTATFTAFNSQLAALRAAGVRITGPGATVAQDLEPEYITFSGNGQTAWVTLQENNAIALLDITTATITQILPLGTKNHNLAGNGLDASDQDGPSINIQNQPVFGLYQPDAIASFTANGQTYYITANEGDAREYTGFAEEVRVGSSSYVLDPTLFPNAATLKANTNLGRLTVTNATGDTDGDGDFDRIEVFGSRSFSIWDASGAQVFDSGDQLEQLTAAQVPGIFNSNGSFVTNTFDTRSDNKGPEPEGVVVGTVGSRTYAFIGLERTGDIAVYDVTNPTQPTFTQYVNAPDDIGPEGLTFIPAADSPNGRPLLVTANEVSNTVAVFEIASPTLISAVQGSGSASPLVNQIVTIEGVVVADFQLGNQLSGFFIQEENGDRDGNSATSEGIFVFTGNTPLLGVQEGQVVRVTGRVDEFFNMTQLNTTVAGSSITLMNDGNNLSQVTPTVIDLPATGDINAFYEQFEGMRVQFADKLYVSEYFELARYGQIVLTADARPFQYSHVDSTPTVGEFSTFRDNLNRNRIILDDDNNRQNAPLPNGVFFHPQPGGFGTGTQGTNFFRGGDTVSNLTGVLHWSFAGQTGTDAWRIRPTQATPVTFTVENPRPTTAPVVGGNIKVANFNVLNYFTTIDTVGGSNSPRGADSVDEFNRQNEKLISALAGINADILGLVEIENNGTAIQTLVNRLNAVVGAGTYDYIDTGVVGTDQITVAIIYKPGVVTPQGAEAVLLDPGFTNPNGAPLQRNRPAIAQTFQVTNASNPDFGEEFTVVVNHLKSKGGSDATGADVDQLDGQGQFNDTRTKAANYLVNTWLPTDPTGQGDPDYLIIGDLNSYRREDPITTIKNAGYTDLIEQFGGNNAYSFVFDGQLGYLDHALSNASMTPQVTGVAEWHINADEVPVFDYNNTIDDGAGEQSFEAKPTGNNLYEPNAFRTSDHDPVIIGLDLGASINIINGTSDRDELVGTDGNDRITGRGSADILVGGLGNDEFVYTDLRDSGDRIVDFTVSSDRIVLSQLLDSIVAGGYSGTNAIADGYVQVATTGSANTFTVELDVDGPGGPGSFVPFIVVQGPGLTLANLALPGNFVF